jgi:hypothetical protein
MADCQCKESSFSATATEEDGRRTLRVEGTCECRTTGYSLELEPDNPGVVPHPEDVVLRLVEHAPQVGEDTKTATAVSPYVAQIGHEATRVIIRVPGAEPVRISISE